MINIDQSEWEYQLSSPGPKTTFQKIFFEALAGHTDHCCFHSSANHLITLEKDYHKHLNPYNENLLKWYITIMRKFLVLSMTLFIVQVSDLLTVVKMLPCFVTMTCCHKLCVSLILTPNRKYKIVERTYIPGRVTHMWVLGGELFIVVEA